jgi:hypothetical protein
MTTTKTTKAFDVLNSFESLSLLKEIAHSRLLLEKDDDISRSALLKLILDDIKRTGYRKALKILTTGLLLKLSKCLEWEDKSPSGKQLLVKKLSERLEEDSKGFIEKVEPKYLKEALEYLESDVPASSKDYGAEFLIICERFGLENLLSSFEVSKLQEFAEDLDLEVKSKSIDNLLDCIMNLSSHEPERTHSKPQISKSKPDLKKGVSVADITAHYSRLELTDYLKNNSLPTHGKKKEMAKRIVNYLEGHEEKKKSPKKSGKRKAEDSGEEVVSKKEKKTTVSKE